MFKTIYAGIGRYAYFLVRHLLRRRMNGNMTRVRVVIINERDEVLLVRSWFSRQKWSLPGGGIQRLETSAQAAVREVFEETALLLASNQLQPLGTFTHEEPTPFRIECMLVRLRARPVRPSLLRRFEILDAAWVPLGSLPGNRSKTVDDALALLPR